MRPLYILVKGYGPKLRFLNKAEFGFATTM